MPLATNRTETINCRVCQNSAGNRIFTAREMMFGSRETFDYIECASCGCIQIIEIPADIEKYYHYPQTFYSLEIRKNPPKMPVRTYLRRQRSKCCLLGNNNFWPLCSKKYGSFSWFRKTNTTFDSKILDVGCGYGKLLLRMQIDGFFDLTGVDPFSYTAKSMQILSEKAGFRISDIDYDSTERQFIISELYSKDISLKDSNSYLKNPHGSIFSKQQIEAFKAKVIELNQKGDGDQACFYLHKV